MGHSQTRLKTGRDPVIETLVFKKKALLTRLLQLSIQGIIAIPGENSVSELRQKILCQLERTDLALQSREKQLGIEARRQEKQQYRMIGALLEAIRENNAQHLCRLEQAKRRLEKERASLEKGSKLSGYISQQKSFRTLGISKAEAVDRLNGRPIVSGTV